MESGAGGPRGLPYPDARASSRRPGRLQRHGHRGVEQRLWRRAVCRRARRAPVDRGRLRRGRRLGPVGRRRGQAWSAHRPATAGVEGQRSRALRLVAPAWRRLLLRHLHAGGTAAGSRPTSRPRSARRTRRAPPDRDGRVTVERSAGYLCQRPPARDVRLRRLPPDRFPKRALRAERGISTCRVAPDRWDQCLPPARVVHVSPARRPRRADHRPELRGGGLGVPSQHPARHRVPPLVGGRGHRSWRDDVRRGHGGVRRADARRQPSFVRAGWASCLPRASPLARWWRAAAASAAAPEGGRSGAAARDEHGNAIGGIRWPDLEAPLGTHTAEHFGDGLNMLIGNTTAFPPEKIRASTRTTRTWLAPYGAALDHLVETEVVLPDDAAEMRARAEVRPLPV